MEEESIFTWKTFLVILVIFIFIGSVFVMAFRDAPIEEETQSVTIEQGLAECLNFKNAVMYYSPTCSWCQQEIADLGDQFPKIKSIDCSQPGSDCSKLKGVPTWEIDGELIPGYKTVEQLKALTDCE